MPRRKHGSRRRGTEFATHHVGYSTVALDIMPHDGLSSTFAAQADPGKNRAPFQKWH
jgi:hypothetical protein